MKIAAVAGAVVLSALAWRVAVCSRAPRVEAAFVPTADREYAVRGTSCGCDMLLLPSRSEFAMRVRAGDPPSMTEETANGTTVRVRAGVLADARSGWYEVEVVRQGRQLSYSRRTVDLPNMTEQFRH